MENITYETNETFSIDGTLVDTKITKVITDDQGNIISIEIVEDKGE